MPRIFNIVLIVLIMTTFADAQQARRDPNPTLVSVSVEGEGQSGLWVQALQDLSAAEVTRLERLIKSELSKLKAITLVDPKHPSAHLHAAIVAGQLDGRWIVASSVLEVATEKGEDLFAAHDVIAQLDLAQTAKAIAGQILAFKTRIALGVSR